MGRGSTASRARCHCTWRLDHGVSGGDISLVDAAVSGERAAWEMRGMREYRQHLGEVTEGLAEASRTMETLQECKRMQLAEYSGTSLPPAYLQKTGQKCDGGFILDLKPSSSVDACKQRCSQLSSCDMFHHKADEEVCVFYKESDSASCLADTGVDTYVRRR